MFCTLKCLINRVVKINGWWSENFVNFNKREGARKKSVNERKKRHKCLLLMLNLQVSKQTRSEAGKNKVVIKRVSNTSIN